MLIVFESHLHLPNLEESAVTLAIQLLLNVAAASTVYVCFLDQ